MDFFSRACIGFGFNINLKKTEVMFNPPQGQSKVKPNILVQDTRLDVDDSLVYLGCTLFRDGFWNKSKDKKIQQSLRRARKSSVVEQRYHYHNQTSYEAALLRFGLHIVVHKSLRKIPSCLFEENPEHQIAISTTRHHCSAKSRESNTQSWNVDFKNQT